MFRNLILTLFAVLVMACGRSDSGRSDAAPVIAVSTPALGRLVEEIGGDNFRVVVLIPSGADPENYEPEMSAMKQLGNADALFSFNTVGFEQSLTGKMASAFPDLQIVNVADGIEEIRHTHGDGEHDDAGHAVGDPHLLSSPRNARIAAANIAAALRSLNPSASAEIDRRSALTDSLLTAIDSELTAAMAPAHGKAFLVMHPSMSYFARDYGLRQIALEVGGKQPSPRQLAERMQDARDAGVEVMIVDRSKVAASSADIARRLQIRQLPLDFNAADFLDQYRELRSINNWRKRQLKVKS